MNLLFFFKPGLYVSKQTVIHGNVTTDSNGYIAGIIHGDITTQATLIVEKNGVINGNAYAKNVIVKGRINGNVHSDGKINVFKTGEVDGHIYATEVNINKESLLKGDITKLQDADNNQNDHKKEGIVSESIRPGTTDESVNEADKPQSWF
jgi:cytoskeletal protein CcmA (bactofilin family)